MLYKHKYDFVEFMLKLTYDWFEDVKNIYYIKWRKKNGVQDTKYIYKL